MNCLRCKDTGYIETGNNDLPCDCPAGDTAMFNVAGIKVQVSGKMLKEYPRDYSGLKKAAEECAT